MLNWNTLKSITLVVALVTSGTFTTVNAQTIFSDVKKEMHDLTEVIGDYTHDRRDALAESSRKTLQNIDEKTQELNTRVRGEWDKMSDTAKANAQAAMDVLYQRRLAVAERLGALEQSSSETWSEIRTGFSAAFTELRMAWENARSEFDED